MEKPKTYCETVGHVELSNVHRAYHDNQYGFPIDSDNELFGRLILEINQAGLSWTTILNKQESFRQAYANFDIRKVAQFNANDRKRLLNDRGIVRNRLKVEAAIYNANCILDIQKEFGAFKSWLHHHHPKRKKDWIRLFKKTFKFTGGEITNEFLVSTGYLKGAHEESCPVYKQVLKENPMWYAKSI
jgi:DNA-3-methyladenine glycosylase I